MCIEMLMISRIWISLKRKRKIVVEFAFSLSKNAEQRDKVAREKHAQLVIGGR